MPLMMMKEVLMMEIYICQKRIFLVLFQWCFNEDLFWQRLAEYIAEFCINSGSCTIM